MVAAKFVTLIGAALESAAHRSSMLIDLAGVRFGRGAVVHAGANMIHFERHFAEVAFLKLLKDVEAPGTFEAHEIFGDYEDRTRSLEAAGAAKETIEIRRGDRVGRVPLRGKPSVGGMLCPR